MEDTDNANNEWLSSIGITMSMDGGITSEENNNQVKVGSNGNVRPTIGSYNNPNSSSSSSSSSNNNNNNNDSSLRVIDFSNNGLTGTIQRTVVFNNNLEILALQRNVKLTGTIPTEIALLKNLIQLQLSDCDLYGRLPLDFLLKMPKLERLIVAYNRLTGKIPGDIILTNYRTINDNNSNGDNNNETILLYSPLNGFNIGDNRMTGTLPTTLGLLRNLSYLQLFGNGFNGNISKLGLDNLSSFWLHDNPNLVGKMPCPTIDYEAVSNNKEAQQQQESSTIFLDYASDCSSNPNIICTCCNRCF